MKFAKIPAAPNIMPDHHYFAFPSIFTSAAVVQSKLHLTQSYVVIIGAPNVSNIPAPPNIMPDHH
jgi:hypothetical protein